MKFFTDIRLLLVGLWLGASVFFIAVAQSAFAVLPSRELAGAVVGRSLTVLNIAGMIIGAIVLLTGFAGSGRFGRFSTWLERIMSIVLIAACAAGEFVIGLMISSVRAQIGGRAIDELAIDDPLRLQFNSLHMYSEWVLLAAMAAALVAFFAISNKKTVEKKAASDPYNFEKEFKI